MKNYPVMWGLWHTPLGKYESRIPNLYLGSGCFTISILFHTWMFCFVSGGSSSSGYYPPAHLGQVSNEAMALLRLSMLLLPSAAVALSSRMILGVVEIK